MLLMLSHVGENDYQFPWNISFHQMNSSGKELKLTLVVLLDLETTLISYYVSGEFQVLYQFYER